MSKKLTTGLYKFKGLNTRDPAHLLADGELTVAQGVSFDDLGALSKRFGRVLRGTVSNQSIDNCDTVANWTTGDATNFALTQETVDIKQGTGALKVSAAASIIQQTSYDNSGDTISSVNWSAQTFTPTITGALQAIDVVLMKINSPGDITVEVRTTSGGLPTSTILASTTIPASSVIINESWVRATFTSPATVTTSTQYAIVIRTIASGNDAYVIKTVTGNLYGGGTSLYSTDSGATWVSESTDKAFKLYITPSTYHIDRDFGVNTVNLSTVNSISFWVKTSISLSLRFSMGEASATEQNYDFTTLTNTWQKFTWDISAIPAASRDAIKYLRLSRVGNLSSNCTIILDDISKPQTAVVINSGKRYTKSDGTKLTVVAAGQDLYGVDSNFAFTSIGTASTADKKFTYAVFNDKLIAGNGYDNLKAWTGTGSVADLAASAPAAAKYPLVHRNYLFVVVGKYTLQWSALGDETSWPATNTINFDKNDGDWITGIAILGVEGGLAAQSALVVFKNKAIYVVYGSDFTNGDDVEVQKVVADSGCIATHSIKSIDGRLIFLAHDGIRVFNGQRSEFIAKRIKPTTDNINQAALDNVVSTIYKRQYILSYPDGVSTVANKYIRGHIDKRMSANPVDFDIAWLGPENIGYSCFILYDAPTDIIKLYGGDPAVGKLFQVETGNDDDGAAITLVAETGEMSLSPDELPDYITNIYLQKENTTSNSNPLTVNLSYDGSASGTDFIIDDQEIQNKINTIACGRGYRHRLKFTNTSIFPYKIKGFTREYVIKRNK